MEKQQRQLRIAIFYLHSSPPFFFHFVCFFFFPLASHTISHCVWPYDVLYKHKYIHICIPNVCLTHAHETNAHTQIHTHKIIIINNCTSRTCAKIYKEKKKKKKKVFLFRSRFRPLRQTSVRTSSYFFILSSFVPPPVSAFHFLFLFWSIIS